MTKNVNKSTTKKTVTKSATKTAEPKKKLPAMNPPEDIVTVEDKNEFQKLDGVIYDSMENISKSGYAVAFAIHTIYMKKLYRVDGYKNVYSYALERYGLSRTTCNDFINMVERFGKISGNEKECITEIRPEYELYGNSQLLAMKGYNDAEIKDAKITPSMSVREIKKALKGEKPDDKESEKPDDKESKSDGKASRKAKTADADDSRYFNLVAEVTHSIGLDSVLLHSTIDKLLLMGHKIYICDVIPEHEQDFKERNIVPSDAPQTGEKAPNATAPEKSPEQTQTA